MTPDLRYVLLLKGAREEWCDVTITNDGMKNKKKRNGETLGLFVVSLVTGNFDPRLVLRSISRGSGRVARSQVTILAPTIIVYDVNNILSPSETGFFIVSAHRLTKITLLTLIATL